jgi:hypothetical protein
LEALLKIVIGSVEVEIKNGGRISYDSETDVLNIEPIQPVRRTFIPKQLLLEHDRQSAPATTGLTKTTLTAKVMELVSAGEEPTSLQALTVLCLGRNAPDNQKQYLKLLLEEMADEGSLVMSMINNRRQFAAA